MELSLKKFEEMNLYSNKMLEKVASSLVNESSNAVLINMFEDCVLLLDHKEGQFYLADYDFNQKDATFTFENFDPIVLSKTDSEFKKVAQKFFEEDEIGTTELAENYIDSVVNQDAFISDLITEAMVGKDFSEVVDYSELSKVNEGTLGDEKFFNAYKDRLGTHPTTAIKFFNWHDPVKVSLLETETVKIVSKNAATKAHDLWKKEEFKKAFAKAASTFIEDVESGTDEFKTLFEEYPQVYRLDAADRKTLFGKTAIAVPELRESRADLVKGLGILFEKFDLNDEQKAYLAEAGEEPEGESEEDVAPELSAEEIKKIGDELKKVADKVTDEKLKAKITGLADELCGNCDEGTKVDLVKEAVEILSL